MTAKLGLSVAIESDGGCGMPLWQSTRDEHYLSEIVDWRGGRRVRA